MSVITEGEVFTKSFVTFRTSQELTMRYRFGSSNPWSKWLLNMLAVINLSFQIAQLTCKDLFSLPSY